MSETKHTPGPWHIEEEGEVIAIVGPRENCSRNGVRPSWELAKIDNYVFWDEPETEAEDRANARLIAAAPDMLAALELVRSIIVEGSAVGFNPLDGGDWAERLYRSQSTTAAAVKKAGGDVRSKAEVQS